jgi:PAS domain S-box-containing protein
MIEARAMESERIQHEVSDLATDGGAPPSAMPDPAELSATEMQYHLFVERVRDYAIFLMDAEGVITHWGQGAARMKEFTAEEAVGMHLRDLYPPEGGEDGTADEHLRAAEEEGEYIGEGTRRARDRGRFPARVVLTSLWRDGRLYGFSKVTQDLTERKRAEERVELALRAAQAGSVEKSRFLATMSHEIRTPINAVLGYADLLDLEIAGPLTDAQRDYIARLRSSGRHLLSLIEDVLDFSRVEAGRLTVVAEQTRVDDVMRDAISLLSPQLDAAGLRLDVQCDPDAEFWGDATRVRQILLNLLGNAAKFTPAAGRIAVRCGADGDDDDAPPTGPGPWTCIRVEDDGIGIAPERLGDVFEPFVQVQNTLTREHAGTGLGLAISRRLARLQGGDLTVRSAPGEGSVFRLWLPASPASVAGDAADTLGREAVSLTLAGQQLSSASYAIVRAVSHRLRVDPTTRQVTRGRTRSELEDHLANFVADIAQQLVVLGEDGVDSAAIVQDGHDVQRLLAERHGSQRRRIGFTEAALVREHTILQEEIESVLRNARLSPVPSGADEAHAIVNRLLARSREIALHAFASGS